jgi:hypothetical protein
MFGLGGLEGGILLVLAIGYFLPFLINIPLAASRGKSVALIVLLTVIFSWIVTLILAMLPKVAPPDEPRPPAPTYLND